jgi:hypothetical protein
VKNPHNIRVKRFALKGKKSSTQIIVIPNGVYRLLMLLLFPMAAFAFAITSARAENTAQYGTLAKLRKVSD